MQRATWHAAPRPTETSFSVLTPTMCTSLLPYLLCSAERWGILARHGGHHVAQNSTTTTCLGAPIATGLRKEACRGLAAPWGMGPALLSDPGGRESQASKQCGIVRTCP